MTTTVDFEGQTQGTAVSTANAGLGASGGVTLNGGSIIFDSGSAIHGSMGAKCTVSASTANQTSFRLTADATSTSAAVSFAFTVPVAPATNPTTVATFRNDNITRINWTTANALQLVPKTGAALDIATGLTPGQYFLDVALTAATSTTGTLTIVLYNSAGTQVGSTLTSSTTDLGTTGFATGDFGIVNTNPTTSYAVSIDYIRWTGGSTALAGFPAVSNFPAAVAVATSAASATLRSRRSIAGTAPATSAASSALKARLALAGTAPATSAASAAFGSAVGITGTAPATSDASSSFGAAFGMSGTASASSAASVAFGNAIALVGSAVGSSAASVAFGVGRALSGIAAAASAAAGAFGVQAGAPPLDLDVRLVGLEGSSVAAVELIGSSSAILGDVTGYGVDLLGLVGAPDGTLDLAGGPTQLVGLDA